ncbi:MAG TPA: response regulator [Bacteroidota bacterium]|nr:response regulator [Bacteroidota bacterium]
MAKLLVVEDNEINRDMMVRRLQRRGYTLVTAVDGQQGIDMARSEKPDLILMDMSLPVLDGWEATRQIKKDESLKHIPVVGLTAHAMVGDRDQALQAGCDDYATKPVEFEKLIELINRLIQV